MHEGSQPVSDALNSNLVYRLQVGTASYLQIGSVFELQIALLTTRSGRRHRMVDEGEDNRNETGGKIEVVVHVWGKRIRTTCQP